MLSPYTRIQRFLDSLMAHTSRFDGITSSLAGKQSTLVSGTNIKTVNGNTLLGSGDLVINSMVYPGAGIAVSTGSAWTTSITDNSTNWNTAYTNRISSLTTTGNNGSATLVSNVLNIPTYTLAIGWGF